MYRSRQLWVPPGSRGVFGGQVLGQALVAATKTAPDSFVVHSLHSYFLLPGDVSRPIIYRVGRPRDGSSFVTRSVEARQKGKVMFKMMVSFQRPEVFDLEHQYPMPSAPPPETLESEEDKLKQWVQMPNMPQKYHDLVATRLAQPIPIEIKHTQPMKVLSSKKHSQPRQLVWMRAKGDLGDLKQTFHQCVAAYISDHVFLTTALLAHGMNSFHPKLKYMATLDHSMWFHAPFRADEPMLFEMESPRTGGNRGLVFGRLYTQDGRLAVSCTQEGLIRTKDASPKL